MVAPSCASSAGQGVTCLATCATPKPPLLSCRRILPRPLSARALQAPHLAGLGGRCCACNSAFTATGAQQVVKAGRSHTARCRPHDGVGKTEASGEGLGAQSTQGLREPAHREATTNGDPPNALIRKPGVRTHVDPRTNKWTCEE